MTTAIKSDSEVKKGEVFYIPLKHIFSPRIKARTWVNPERVKDIATSAIAHGILQPILLSPIPDKKDRYHLVYGQHRIAALKYIQEHNLDVTFDSFFPLDRIKAEIRTLTPSQMLEIALLENENREDQNPIDKIIGILNLIKMELTEIMQGDGLDCECDDHYAKAVVDSLFVIDQPKTTSKGVNLQTLENYTTVCITRYAKGIPAIDLEATRAIIERFNLSSSAISTQYIPLLSMCKDVIYAIQMGWVEYPKGRIINQILDDRYRLFLLDLVRHTGIRREAVQTMVRLPKDKHQELMELVEGKDLTNKEIEAIAEDLNPNKQEVQLKKHFSDAVKKIKKNKDIWQDSKKVQELNQLITKIMKLIS